MPPTRHHPAAAPPSVCMQALQDTAQQLGTTVDALALAAIIAQPFKPMVLSGATTVEQLESNAQALQLVGRLDAGVLQQLMAAMVQPAEEYWAERAQLAWN
jgi:aryl-alcohol dehydrogenase-like predicted oxidoreductase